jgi:putative endonuclease
MEWDKFWAENKQVLETTAARYMGVMTPGEVLLTLTNVSDEITAHSTPIMPQFPDKGSRVIRRFNKVFLDHVDALVMNVGEQLSVGLGRRDGLGRRAETIAAWFLIIKGYRIMARRGRTRGGEIDIVARSGDTLVFVEVKARATLDSAIFALHPSALRWIEAASRVLAPRFGTGCTTTRIDAVLVRPWALPVHLVAIGRERD